MVQMLADPQLDPSGSLILEARADPDVAALVGVRVRGPEAAKDDAKGPGEYQAFVTISCLSAPIHPSLPITFGEYGIDCYGTTYQNAWAVYAAMSKAFHQTGPRTKSNGLGIYKTAILFGGTEDADPQTQQPIVRGTLRVIATAVPV